MGIKKRVFALLLAVLLSFGVCAVDYLKVDALDVGGGFVSWETANNFLFGLLGIAPSEKTMEEYVDWDEWRSAMATSSTQYFIDHLREEDLPEGKTKDEAIQDWIFSVCHGELDKLSPCWDLYKDWCAKQVTDGMANGGGASSSLYGCFSAMGLTMPSQYELYRDTSISCAYFIKSYDDNEYYFYIVSDGSMTLLNGGDSFNYTLNTGGYFFNGWYQNKGNTLKRADVGTSSGGASIFSSLFPFRYYYPSGILSGTSSNTSATFSVLDLGASSVSSDEFVSVVSAEDIPNISIVNDYSNTTTQNVVSIDWDRIGAMFSDAVGTVTGSLDRTISDALDDAQEKVAAGTMSVANYNDYVTEISNTYVYDITNETSITNPDSTVTGVVSGNVAKSEFTLAGLQYVFPFCIPWDIRDFVMLLVADPVAPVIEYPIYNPVTDTNEIVTIDFSLWENQVRIIRYIFDFLLIIGLLLLARSLIGAGGGD